MAKANFSPLNNWRGRAGGQVYRVRNGVQIVSAYQSAVANPKTEAQLLQRAKFNLMTKLNSLFDARLLNGFSSSKGIARAMFSKKLMPNIYAQLITGPGEEKYRANISPQNIVFGPNQNKYLVQGETIASHIQIAAAGTVARLTFTTLADMLDVDPDTAKVRIVDVYGSDNSTFSYVDVLCNNINGEIVNDMPASLDFAGLGVHRFYLQVLAPTEDLRNNFNGGSLVDEGGDDVLADSVVNTGGNFAIGGSVYLGTVSVTSA